MNAINLKNPSGAALEKYCQLFHFETVTSNAKDFEIFHF